MVRYHAMYGDFTQRVGGDHGVDVFLVKIYFCVLCCGVCVGKDEMLLFFCGDVVTHRW